MPRRCRISSAKNAEPSGAPNNTVNAAAIPAIVRQRASSVEIARRRASQPASVPHVVTSGASGPAAPPAEIVSSDIGTSERSERTLGRRPGDVDVVDEQLDVARAAEHSERSATTAIPAPASTDELRGAVRSAPARPRAAAGGSRADTRRRPRRSPIPTSTVAPSSAGDIPSDHRRRTARSPLVSRSSDRHIVVRYTCDRDPRKLGECAHRRRLRSAPRLPRRAPSFPALERAAGGGRGHHARAAPAAARDPRARGAPRPPSATSPSILLLRHHSAVGTRRPRGRRRSRRAARRPRRSAARAAAGDTARRAVVTQAGSSASRRAAPAGAGRHLALRPRGEPA